MNQEPLVNKKYLLEKMPGKGGWTYAALPGLSQDRTKPFGWMKVRGTIDGYEIRNYNLMPMGQGRLFLPVRSEIRKKIAKKEGDWVQVVLFPDEDPLVIPDELTLCLREEPAAFKVFMGFPEGEQKAYINWIFSAKKTETKIDRIAKTINRLLNNQKFTDRV